MTSASLTALALVIEAVLGYPETLLRRIGHPVIWIGAMIARLDVALNRANWTPRRRRLAGAVTVVAIVTAAAGPAWIIQHRLASDAAGVLILAVLSSSLFAQRSLHDHVAAVAAALARDGLTGGRREVAKIVGRNPASLDEAGVARAAIESLAENFSDAVVAPAIWGALLGLPGIAAYKATNTADSMIGHRTERHAAFGWAAARLDDVVNLPAARLTAIWIILAAIPLGDAKAACRAVIRDARRHRSPNAGWPEAAMAGALGLRLAGPRVYGATRVEDAWMGEGRAEVTPGDIRCALAIYRVACALQIAAVAILAIIARG